VLIPARLVAISGIGVDCCEVERMRRALAAPSGARFRERVFTGAEQAYCEARRATRCESYAARFAAKEAAMKVLGTGWSQGVTWLDVEVLGAAGAPPVLRLHGVAAAVARRLGIARWLVSLSHTASTAVAFVVAEGGRVRAGGPSRVASPRGAATGSARPRPRARRPAR